MPWATKEDTLSWNVLELFNEPSTVQCDESFQKQKLEIKLCLKAIDKYADIGNTNMINIWTYCGYAGSSKSWCMQYLYYTVCQKDYLVY